MEKSYITLAVCPICRKETGTLLMDTILKPTFKMHTVTPEPCDECSEQYLLEGVLLIEAKTGSIAVIKTSAFERIFNIEIPSKHIAFVEEGLLTKIGAL